MDSKQVAETVGEVGKLIRDYFFRPLISTALERYGVDNARDIGYFLQDAPVYLENVPFMEEGVAELMSFFDQVKKKVLPFIDEALLISPFSSGRRDMAEEELLYRKMMSHIFEDNLELLHTLVVKLEGAFPVRETLPRMMREEPAYKQAILVRA